MPVSLRKGDGGCQPKELLENTLIWTQSARLTLYGEWLTWQVIVKHSIDPAEGVKLVEMIESGSISTGDIIIECKKEIFQEVKKYRAGLVL